VASLHFHLGSLHLSLAHSLPFQSQQHPNYILIVPSDTAISISFGIISVCVSLLGVWIGYLTLRAMILEAGMDYLVYTHLFSQYSLILFSSSQITSISREQ
jgi:hypothetical protein